MSSEVLSLLQSLKQCLKDWLNYFNYIFPPLIFFFCLFRHICYCFLHKSFNTFMFQFLLIVFFKQFCHFSIFNLVAYICSWQSVLYVFRCFWICNFWIGNPLLVTMLNFFPYFLFQMINLVQLTSVNCAL